jgi:hypothetical protein
MKNCYYYQAIIETSQCWFVVGVLRSFEHLAFDRTLDKQKSLFEFFVPGQQEANFLGVMDFFIAQGVVTEFQKLDNRLSDPHQAL